LVKNIIGVDNFVLPTSSGQERLWFLQALDERLGAAYNISTAFKIQNNINRIILQKAINIVVSRHEALRTGICKVNNVLQQIVDPYLLITVNYFDLIKENLSDIEKYVVNEIQLEARNPFILSTPGMVRFSLYRTQVDLFYFLIVTHHSISDGVSVEIIFREIITCYLHMLRQENIILPELPFQFADVAAWQNARITANIEKEHILYWKNKLRGVNTVVQFPEGRTHLGEPTFRGETLPFYIEAGVFSCLTSLSKELRVSPYSILLSVFALLIHYNTGETDFLIGVPTVNRGQKETWPVVGYLANTVVIRVNIGLVKTVKELLLQINDTMSEGLSHQDLCISKVVNAIQSERAGNLSTIFQFMFSYQESNDIQKLLDSFKAQKLLVDNGLSKFDIFLFLLNQNNTVDGFFEYSTDLFENTFMHNLIKHFIIICNNISANISSSIYSHAFLNSISLEVLNKRIHQSKNKSGQLSISSSENIEAIRKNTSIEDEIEIIWQELLNINNSISIYANFFELGGNSLLVTKLVDAINRKLNVSIPIKIIFIHPCIERIAGYIDSLKKSPVFIDSNLEKIIKLYDTEDIFN
jgi:hypothetical protein